MIIIAPKQKSGGLDKVEQGLRKYSPETILNNLYSSDEIILRLPRFKMESTLNLVPILKKVSSSVDMFDFE